LGSNTHGHWPLDILDDGFAEPFACYWFAHDRDVSDTIYIIRELYQRHMTPEDVAENIRRLDGDEKWRGVIDSSAFADTGMGARGDVMNRLGCKWSPVEKYPGSRLAGLSAIRARRATRKDGTVGLKIFRGYCPNLLREITGLVYSTKNPELRGSCDRLSTIWIALAAVFGPDGPPRRSVTN
jgi:hypothetical protein